MNKVQGKSGSEYVYCHLGDHSICRTPPSPLEVK